MDANVVFGIDGNFLTHPFLLMSYDSFQKSPFHQRPSDDDADGTGA